jgi:hypothetical protein
MGLFKRRGLRPTVIRSSRDRRGAVAVCPKEAKIDPSKEGGKIAQNYGARI